MYVSRLRSAALAIAASVGLSACVYDDGYGYGGLSVGYGNAGYCDPYWDDCYRGYGHGYGRSYYSQPYWGWYNGFYYPGTGIYVYDSFRRPHRWNDRQSRYWIDRQRSFRHVDRGDRREFRENWRDFRQDRRVDNRAFRQQRRTLRTDLREGDLTREQFRTQRRDLRQDYRQERRQDRRELRRENRRDRRD
jgi:hypothetical protein